MLPELIPTSSTGSIGTTSISSTTITTPSATTTTTTSTIPLPNATSVTGTSDTEPPTTFQIIVETVPDVSSLLRGYTQSRGRKKAIFQELFLDRHFNLLL